MHALLLARHAHSAANTRDVVNGVPPGEGLSPSGVEQAHALGEALAGESLDLGLATELRRTRETLELALAGRRIEIEAFPGLNEIGFGAFEGGLLERYRGWAWTTAPEAPCPGGGESRAAVAARLAGALERLLERPERTILAVSHALPVRYVLDGAAARIPARRVEPVPHANAFRLDADGVALAARTLRGWSESPRFRDVSAGG